MKKEISEVPKNQTLSWNNWSKNVIFNPTEVDGNYYHLPCNFDDLKTILQKAQDRIASGEKITIRVSGQRHSATPLVIDAETKHGQIWIVDLSQYNDLGPTGEDSIVLNEDNTVTVNSGVREDQLSIFLTKNNLHLKTGTAGGFFSIGGIVAVDVHGSNVNNSIFSSNVIEFTVINSKGEKQTYNKNSPQFEGHNIMDFYYTSLGALGIITSVTLEVSPRPYKTSIEPSCCWPGHYEKNSFIKTIKPILTDLDFHQAEFFFSPYKYPTLGYAILILEWKKNTNPKCKTPNDIKPVPNNQKYLLDKSWGAPYLSGSLEKTEEKVFLWTQNCKMKVNGQTSISTAQTSIHGFMKTAEKNNSLLWLPKALKVGFMSYFIPLPDNADYGLDAAWNALEVIINAVESKEFVQALPVEFRFVENSSALLSGTYSSSTSKRFISIEIEFASNKDNTYAQNTLNFLAKVEYQWRKLGGLPHHGKMYGFYNPDTVTDENNITGTPPFNKSYLSYLKELRKENFQLFSKYQKTVDPDGLFSTKYLEDIGVCNYDSHDEK
ncbi:D-arabinono-1,4-lactone oxidase [Francisella sp. 19X1-34]|uniref:D-arabinono-1,4-lactone oxidase n=1 Tax=Francisella sp. 19X1-34 TaxID=3087177 RepID=UPI002E325E16|nr:D-arabinono-1,4-lactone oxidase [Francisella sp. 19X1-34]MED7789651.1 D-arabinono-1,4-lactone oxidase [Francisella sp. 19X1-34]